MQFYGQLFDLLVGLMTKRSYGTLAIHDFNKGLLWADVLGKYPESVMMFMYADRQKQTHNWLVHIMNVRKNLKMQTCKHASNAPFITFFLKIRFLF